MTGSQDFFADTRQQVEALLDRHLPLATERPHLLHEAMRYAVFSGGKRLRPLLCVSAAQALDQAPDKALPAAAAVELLHTYTLVHDDLPSMDDDEFRRGVPTCHMKYGEANALLAGDALLTLAFEVLSTAQPAPVYTAGDLVRELAQATGSRGTVAGQVEDLAAEGKQLSVEELHYIHLNKTAALFRASVRLGAMSAGATGEDLKAISLYGEHLGLAFQLVDDVLDATKHDHASALAVYGEAQARQQAKEHLSVAQSQLSLLPGDTVPLTAIAQVVAAPAL